MFFVHLPTIGGGPRVLVWRTLEVCADFMVIRHRKPLVWRIRMGLNVTFGNGERIHLANDT